MNHHACLVRQETRDIPGAVALYGNELSTEVVVLTYDTVTIADTRSIIAAANRRPSNESTQLLVVCFYALLPEAEQALLKVIEEPPLTTKF